MMLNYNDAMFFMDGTDIIDRGIQVWNGDTIDVISHLGGGSWYNVPRDIRLKQGNWNLAAGTMDNMGVLVFFTDGEPYEFRQVWQGDTDEIRFVTECEFGDYIERKDFDYSMSAGVDYEGNAYINAREEHDSAAGIGYTNDGACMIIAVMML